MTRTNLTHVALALLVGTACSDSHGRDDDAGARDAAWLDGGSSDGGPRDAWLGDAWLDDAEIGHDAGWPDAGDGGTGAPCDADDATGAICGTVCDGPDSWYWNGDDCFRIECGACRGADCGRGQFSREACMSEHAGCEAAQCRTSGGSWQWWAEECDHFACGAPTPAICEVGRPVCDCGPFGNFVPGVGCVDDGSCPIPEPWPREAICTASGGSWDAICCDTVCGVPCDLFCAAQACDCGPGKIFEETRGCVEATRCYEPALHEPCEGEARCGDGAICCTRSGGPMWLGPPTCEAPVCDDDPDIDQCGNNLLAP